MNNITIPSPDKPIIIGFNTHQDFLSYIRSFTPQTDGDPSTGTPSSCSKLPDKPTPAFLVQVVDTNPDGEWTKTAFEELRYYYSTNTVSQNQQADSGDTVEPGNPSDNDQSDMADDHEQDHQLYSDDDVPDDCTYNSASDRTVIDVSQITMG
jgi:hypothetical protein